VIGRSVGKRSGLIAVPANRSRIFQSQECHSMTEKSIAENLGIVHSRRRWSRLRMREAIAGYAWTSPWWLGFLVLGLYPMLAGLYYSFTDARWAGPVTWVGLENYVEALQKDRVFWLALRNTAYYSFAVVPLGVSASLFAASVLNQKLRGENFFRTFMYIPSLMPSVALIVIWTWILNPSYGLLNQLLEMVSIHGPRWLSSTSWAMPALILMATWGSFGGTGMLIFLSSLQSIPQELYEACELDGGSQLHRFRYVTVPMISPAIFFNLILGIIGSFQSFLYAFLAPDVPGGPNFATYTLGLHMYKQGFVEGRMSYASAMAWLLFLAILATVLVTYKLSGRWLFMASAEEGDR
jgi:multiple sugar transport system permease protein